MFLSISALAVILYYIKFILFAICMIYLAGDQKIHEWKLISHPLRGPIEIELCPAKNTT